MKMDSDTRSKIRIIIITIAILGILTFYAAVFKMEDKINGWTVTLGMDISLILLTTITVFCAREVYLKFRKRKNK